MSYNIEVRERPAQHIVAISTHSPVQDLPRVIPETMQAIEQYMNEIGQKPTEPPFVSYHNMDRQNLDVKIGFLSPKNVTGKGNIQPGTIPGGKAASVMHVGSYANISAAHDALHRWMEANDHESAGAYYEVYLNDPADTPEEKLQTEIFTLIKGS